MINKSMLLNAISERQSGRMPNFSQIELNQMVDLVLFDNYPIDEVLNMNEYQLDRLANPEEFDFDDYYETETISSYRCPYCGSEMIEDFTDCESDGACDIIYCTCKSCGKKHRFYDYGEDW